MTRAQHRIWLTGCVLGIPFAAFSDLGMVFQGRIPVEAVALDTANALAAVLAGLWLWRRHPRNRIGVLLYLLGIVHSLGGLWSYVPWYTLSPHLWDHQPLLAEISYDLGLFVGGLIVHLLFAYPTGQLRSRVSKAAVALGYASSVVGAGMAWLDRPPSALTTGAYLLLAVTGVGALAFGWHRSGPVGRRTYGPVLAAGILVAVTALAQQGLLWLEMSGLLWPSVMFLLQLGLIAPVNLPELEDQLDLSFQVARLLLSIAFLGGMTRSQLERASVGDLVMELDRPAPSRSLRDMLAKTLHDPSLQVGYWMPERDCFVDASGALVEVPSESSARAVTMIENEGERFAAIVHDPALRDDPRLIEAVASAARLSLERERLQATVRAQLTEVRASRARLIEAADAERRRLERDLHDGAQQGLLSLALMVKMARGSTATDAKLDALLAEAEAQAHRALAEMRELAHGIHPAILTSEGLGAAVEALAERASIPVNVNVAPERFPQAVETTAYYLVSESMSNAVKHSRATHLDITVARRNGSVLVEVADDGIGGADPEGSGLRGLADRVAAQNGSLRVESERGKGTVVRAELPTG